MYIYSRTHLGYIEVDKTDVTSPDLIPCAQSYLRRLCVCVCVCVCVCAGARVRVCLSSCMCHPATLACSPRASMRAREHPHARTCASKAHVEPESG